MAHEVQRSHAVDRVLADALDVFAVSPQIWLPKPLSARGSGRWRMHVRYGERSVEIECSIGAPAADSTSAIRAVTWRLPTRPGRRRAARFFPRFTGHLVLRPTSAGVAELSLVGAFSGAAAAVGLRHFAGLAAQSFVDDAAGQLDQAAYPQGMPRRSLRVRAGQLEPG